MPTVFRTTRHVEFVDTDMAGIVHFSNYFRFMEAAEQEFLRSLNLSVKMDWEGQTISFPRVSANCDYQRPARFDDVLDIAVWIVKSTGKSVSYAFEFARDGDLLVRGHLGCVCCRIRPDHRLESIEIPPTFRAILDQAARP